MRADFWRKYCIIELQLQMYAQPFQAAVVLLGTANIAQPIGVGETNSETSTQRLPILG